MVFILEQPFTVDTIDVRYMEESLRRDLVRRPSLLTSTATNFIDSKRTTEVEPTPRSKLEEIFDRCDHDTAFVHVGLSDVNAALGEGSYETLVEILDESFDSVLAPGYTPSFKRTGIYHKDYSRPRYGMFTRLFAEDADYRTDDAIHSIFVRGDYRFDDCNHQKSFGENSCFAKLDRDNVPIIEIGTEQVSFTHLHQIEFLCDVPYIEPQSYDGVVYYDAESHDHITQRNFQTWNKYIYSYNRVKVEQDLRDADIMDYYEPGGLKLRFTPTNDSTEYLSERIRDDPFYLVD